VKIQGYRIELSEIECVAREFFNGEIATVAVVNSDDKGNNFIQLALEGKDDKQEKELHDYMKSKLPAYMMPQEIHFIGKFPQNANNKIDRKQIKQLIG
jgi:acyl-coenzyme A synthetase/AMP-(fatty) acid ligase